MFLTYIFTSIGMKHYQNIKLHVLLLWICLTCGVSEAIFIEKESNSPVGLNDEGNDYIVNYLPSPFSEKRGNKKDLLQYSRQFLNNEVPNFQLKSNWYKRQMKRRKRVARTGKTLKRYANDADYYDIQRNLRANENIAPGDYCSGDQLINYLARLQVINPESIVNLASSSHLDSLCNNVKSSLADTDAYLKSCELREQKDLYMKLINGVRTLSEKMCQDPKFKTAFMKHANCFSKIRLEYKDCTGPYDWIENPDPNEVCRTYKEIVNCYFNKTISDCGKDAANIMDSLMQQIVVSVITVDCSNSTTSAMHHAVAVSNAFATRTNCKYALITFYLFPIFIYLFIQ